MSDMQNAETKPAPMTTEQRSRIRGLLDRYFDDEEGCYLDGQSDHAIAETLNVPRVWVETLRETAYGPLKTDPRLGAIKKEAAELKVEIDGMKEKLTALYSRQTALVQQISRIACEKTPLPAPRATEVVKLRTK